MSKLFGQTQTTWNILKVLAFFGGGVVKQGKARFCLDGSEKHVLYVSVVVIFVWIKSI